MLFIAKAANNAASSLVLNRRYMTPFLNTRDGDVAAPGNQLRTADFDVSSISIAPNEHLEDVYDIWGLTGLFRFTPASIGMAASPGVISSVPLSPPVTAAFATTREMSGGNELCVAWLALTAPTIA